MNNKKLIEQIVDRLVNEVIYTGNLAGSLEVNGSTAQTLEAFKQSMVQKLTSGATDGAVETVMYQRKIILTDAQIKALPTTPIELVPAPGAGKQLSLLKGDYYLNALAGAYGNVSMDGYICLSHDASSEISNLALTTNWLDQPDEFQVSITPFVFASISGTYAEQLIEKKLNGSLITDKNITIGAINSGGNFTGGHASNTLSVTVFYSIVDL